MKRRRFAGISLALVSGVGYSAARDTEETTTEGTDDRTADQYRPMVSVTGISVEEQFVDPFSVSVEASREEQTVEQPAELLVELEWNGERDVSVMFGNQAPVSTPAYSTERTPGVVLLSPDTTVDRVDAATWVPDVASDEPMEQNLSATLVKFSPGDAITQRVHVWGDPRHVTDVPTGTFVFEEWFGSPDSGAETVDDEAWEDLNSYEFTVELAEQ